MVKLTAEKRGKTIDLAKLRHNGNLPGVVYGALVENTALSVLLRDFQKVYKEVGESEPVSLEIDGKAIPVLIHEVQYDPVKETPIHVDFYAVDLKKEVTVSVPIEFIGEAPAVKQGLGTLVKALHEVEIRALPQELPHVVEVDISSLVDLESQITAADLSFNKGVELITKPSEIIASIATIKEEKEEEAAPIDLSAIEVEKKGKKEEEGEEGGKEE